jgi:hypothetical protein
MATCTRDGIVVEELKYQALKVALIDASIMYQNGLLAAV